MDLRALLLALLLALAAGGRAEEGGRLRLALAPDLATLDGEACHDGPVRLRLLDARGRDHVGELRFETPDGEVRSLAERRTLSLPAGCLRWRSDLESAVRLERGSRARRIGEALALSPNLFLYADEADPRPRTVDLVLPDGVSASVPWTPIDTDVRGEGRYRWVPGPRGWRPLVVLGRFARRTVPVPGTTLRLAVLDGDPPADVDAIADWVRTAAASVATVTGTFPVPSPQVLVLPVFGSPVMGDRDPRGPVPFARVLRDGGAAPQFFVDQRRSAADLDGDWTAAHEFAHLLLPFVERRDAWISEGFASYYQNVLRARTGQQSEADAWRELAEGFARGRGDDGRYAETLHASITGGGENRTMRLYWTGAAVALLADVRLRRAGVEGGLDGVLADLARCCLPADRAWGGRELFARLDDLSGTDVFRTLYDAVVDSTVFPDVSEAWAALGVERPASGPDLSDRGPERALRLAIMAPPGPPLADRNDGRRTAER